MKSKKGLTLVETIIAMAVLVVITLMTFSVGNYVVAQTNKSELKLFFVNESQNYINCYLLGQDEYSNAISFYANKEALYNEDCVIYYSNDLDICDEENSTYSIKLTFEVEKFVVECFVNNNDNAVYTAEV